MALARAALVTSLVNSGFSSTAANAVADAIDAYVKTGQVTFLPGTPITTTAGAGTITGSMTGNVQ